MTQAAFNKIKEGLDDVLAYSRGELVLKTVSPSQIAANRAMRLSLSAKIRQAKGLTQAEFAAKYNIGLSRLQDWEQGRSKPDSLALAYLTVIEKEGEAVERALNQIP